MEKITITSDRLFAGFNIFTRKIILWWRDRVVSYGDLDQLRVKLRKMNDQIAKDNVIIFFDHHYAFDAIPLGFGLAQFLENASGVLIPYSVHLDMGVGREGEFSVRYYLRTLSHKWLVSNIRKPNPKIQFFPIVREFERDVPRINAIVAQRFSGVNTAYLKAFVREFKKSSAGQICFLTPFSGIGFPGKPLLHPQLYRSIDLVQDKCSREFPIFLAGAYPSWNAYSNYLAPLLNEHLLVLRGPFYLPRNDYQDAYQLVESEIEALREEADFVPPDYERILNK
jgi:hypothetical protein